MHPGTMTRILPTASLKMPGASFQHEQNEAFASNIDYPSDFVLFLGHFPFVLFFLFG